MAKKVRPVVGEQKNKYDEILPVYLYNSSYSQQQKSFLS